MLNFGKLFLFKKFPYDFKRIFDKRMEDRKLFILKNAGGLYLRFGIKSVKMDDVARELRISKKTLYQYFKDKADLVSQVVDYYLQNPLFNFNDLQHGNAIDQYFALRAHILTVMKYYHNNLECDLKNRYPKLHRKVHKQKRERIYNNTVENLNDGIKTGLYRSDLDVVIIAKLQVGRMLFTLNPDHGIFTETEISNIDLFDKIVDYHMHSICTEEGLKYYKKQLNNIKHEVNI